MRSLITTRGTLLQPDSKAILERLRTCKRDCFWLNIEAPDDDDVTLLTDTFKFHPLTIEDVRNRNQRPKLEDYPDYQFMVLFAADWSGSELSLHEFHLYLGKDYLVTIHDHPSQVLRDLAQRIEQAPEMVRGRPAFLSYLVVDGVVDQTFPALEMLDVAIDDLEDGIVADPAPAQLRQIYSLKHDVTRLRQTLSNQRDLFQRLITATLQDHELSVYYRDVYDHTIRQYETVDSLRDLLTGAMDVYLSTVSNRLNSTMKQLTVVASLFLPLSFLTGFYGMNFTILTTKFETPYPAFWIGVATMVAATIAQLIFFKRRGWI